MSGQDDNINQLELSSDPEDTLQLEQEIINNVNQCKKFSEELQLCYQIFEDIKKYSESNALPFLDKLCFDDLLEFLFKETHKIYSFESS
jgi:hypothetical protein